VQRGHALDLERPGLRSPWSTRIADRLHRPGERRKADRLLRVSAGNWESHPAVSWRVAELTSAKERRLLARTLRGVVADVSSRTIVVSAAPLDRHGLRPHASSLAALADRFADLERPVTGAGVVLVRDLLCDGGSPLYTGGAGAAELPAALDLIRSTLETP